MSEIKQYWNEEKGIIVWQDPTDPKRWEVRLGINGKPIATEAEIEAFIKDIQEAPKKDEGNV